MRRSQFIASLALGLAALSATVPAHAASVNVFGEVTSVQPARVPDGKNPNPLTKVLRVRRIQDGIVTVFVYKKTKYGSFAGRNAGPSDLKVGDVLQVKGTRAKGGVNASKITILIEKR